MIPHVSQIICLLYACVNRLRIDNFSVIMLEVRVGGLFHVVSYIQIAMMVFPHLLNRGNRMTISKLYVILCAGIFAIFPGPVKSQPLEMDFLHTSSGFRSGSVYTGKQDTVERISETGLIYPATAIYSLCLFGTELLLNGDLEMWSSGPSGPPDHWTHGSGISLEQTTDEVFSGLYAGLVTKLDDGTQTFEQIITYDITGNAQYELSYFIIDDDGISGNRSRAWIYWASEPGGQGFISNSYTGYSADGPGWQEISVSATAPENAVSARVRIAFYGDTGVTYYVDGISLIEVGETTPTPVPSDTPLPTATPTSAPDTPTATPEPTITTTPAPDTPTATPTTTPSVPSPTPTTVPTMPCEHELVWNGDFETWNSGPSGPPDFWMHDSGLLLEQADGTVHGGAYSGKITKLKTDTQFFEQVIPYAIVPGSDYQLSCWVIDDDGVSDNRSRAWIYWASEPGGQGFISNSYTGYSVDGPGWQELTLSAVAPDTAVSARVRIAFYGDTDVTYYVDDISLMELCDATPTPPPTTTPEPTATPTTGPGTPTSTPPPTSSPTPEATVTPTPEPTQASIIINEVLYNPAGSDTGQEFIELVNVSDAPFDLTGYDLKPDTSSYYTFPEFVLAAGARVSVRINTEGEDSEDELFTGLTGNMGNSTGFVALFNSTTHSSSTIVDYVAYGAGGQTWESAAVTAGIWTAGDFVPLCDEGFSMNLDPDGIDTNTSDDWSCCDPSMNGTNCTSAPSPTTTPTPHPDTPTHTPEPTSTPVPRTGVVINEVFFDPEGVDTENEFVELYNNSPYPVTLTGYDLKPDTSSYYTFPVFELEPYAYVTVRINTSGTDTGTDLFTGPTSNMGNSAGYVALFDSITHSVSTIVDYIAYGAGGQTWESTAISAGIWTAGDFIPIPDPEGYSINLCPDGADVDSSLNWQLNDPSAGTANNCADPTPTPTPTGTPMPTRTPTVTPTPRPPVEPVIQMAGFGNTSYRLSTGGTVHMLAWVTDPENDIENVYVMLGGEIIAELFDDGNHGDFGAGDGIYGLELYLPPVPPGDTEGLVRLQLRIVAFDARGFDSHVWPLFTVDPGYDPDWMSSPVWWENPVDGSSSGGGSSSAGNGPRIFMAGFMDTRIRSLSGGRFTMLAFVTGDVPVTKVELYYHGLPTGVLLHDNGQNNDFGAGDGVFGLSLYLEPGMLSPGVYPFQLRATDSAGRESDLWPYLTLNE
jgi:hypothetical protein